MRHAILQLTYNTTNISEAIAPFVTGFSYTDFAGGKADDLQITLDDRDQRWKNDWHPTKGATLRAVISCVVDGAQSNLDCGLFEIDEIKASGPPEQVVINAASAAISKSLRREKKSRPWENTTIQGVAGTIAQEHDLSIYYHGDDLTFTRLDQRDESDLAFLKRICDDNGLNVKISDQKLIIYSGRKFEEKPASFIFKKNDPQIKKYTFDDKADDVYRACEVSYQDPATRELQTHLFTPESSANGDGPVTGQILKVTARVESLEAAKRLAITRLRRKNKKEVKGSFTLLGDPALVAGLNIQVEGYGQYDGKYFIDEAAHPQRGGYTTTIKFHRVLNY